MSISPKLSAALTRRQVLALAASAQALSLPDLVFAQAKPVRLLVGFAPASGADVAARLVAKGLENHLKSGVIVDNKTGAGGIIAGQEVARSSPDGSSLLVAAMPQMAILPSLGKVPYDPVKDFAPIARLVSTDLVFVVNPIKVPVSTMQAYMDWAKTQPALFFGTPGQGSVAHLAIYALGKVMGSRIEPIHFRNTGEQITAMMAGDVQGQFFSHAAALPLVKAGKFKALFTTSPTRSASFAGVPTASEAGHRELEFTSWYGVFAPAATSKALLQKLESDLLTVVKSPETRTRLEEAGLRVTPEGSQVFAETLQTDIRRWSQLVKTADVKA